MAAYTLCISRNHAQTPGLRNGKPIGEIFIITAGDRVTELNQGIQAEIFFFKAVDLTTVQYEEIDNAILVQLISTPSMFVVQ